MNNLFMYNSIGNVVASAVGDVNGDGVPDYVYLTGKKISEGNLIENITLIVKDGKTGITSSAKFRSDTGYSPSLFLGDFTGDRVNDIFISIASGGSGGIMFYYIYTDLNNRLEQIFDYEAFNQKYNYTVNYKDNFKVEVLNTTTGTRFIIDLTYKGKDYLNEIYNPDGTLKAPIEGWVDPLSGLYPVDFDNNGIYELLGYQEIAGRYHADALGYVESSLKWNGRIFYMYNQYVAVFGS